MRGKIIILLAVTLACSCSKWMKGDEATIKVSAVIRDMSVSTKAQANPFKGTYPTEENILNSKVLFSHNFSAFPENNSPSAPHYIPSHTEISFSSSNLFPATIEKGTVEYSLTYPIPSDTQYGIAKTVHCAGLSPVEGWTFESDGKSATHPINGTDDIMFADVKSGEWDRTIPPLEFAHIQTWLKISVCATTAEATRTWGKIDSLKVKTKTAAKITFPTTEGGTSTIEYIDDGWIKVIQKKDINITSSEFCSVFTSPQTTCELIVYTEKYKEGRTVSIPLYDLNNKRIDDASKTKGKLYVISLYFSPFKIINGICTLDYWNDQDENLYLTTPKTSNS
jgi:hypothetical protein